MLEKIQMQRKNAYERIKQVELPLPPESTDSSGDIHVNIVPTKDGCDITMSYRGSFKKVTIPDTTTNEEIKKTMRGLYFSLLKEQLVSKT